MIGVGYPVILVATGAGFVVSFAWYSVFGRELAEVSDAAASAATPPPWKIAVELVRTLVVATVLAGLATGLDITDWWGAVLLGGSLWIGFPVVLLTGSVMWENVPWKMAAIHSGDWLAKLLVIAVIVGVWS